MKLWPFSKKTAPAAAPIETKASGTSMPEDWLTELFTGSVIGSPAVSAATALTVPAVSAAVRTISEAAATLEIIVERKDGENWVQDDDHPAAVLLRGDVNDWTSGFELVRDLVSEALTKDAGGLAWVNRVGEKPMEIIHYDPGTITVQTVETGEPTFHLNGKPLNPADVIHLRGPFSRSPLTLAREAIGAAMNMEMHASRTFANGAKPGGVLSIEGKLNAETAARIGQAWKAAHGGTKTGGVAVLDNNGKYQPVTLTSTDAQFIENRRFQIEEIARAFNISVTLLGDLTRATWSNLESKNREFLVYTLEPWLKALEGALRRALFTPEERREWRIRFDRDDLTRADLGVRATAYSSLVSSRVYNPNELRAWDGMPPYKGGDEFVNPAITPGAAANDNKPKPKPKEAAA
ncbi:phage portal protein [Sinorhizobium meliloti]|uniref:phage portal protein n=1 Tax=Rhizobium meliloti TaxID=382 RepID=UPI001297B620|nr:phage portal protein [Sinorhizobium meliloti]